MHIYFSGIGGAGIGPLAEIAHQAGFMVSGSDKRDSDYIQALKKTGIKNIFIDQSYQTIANVHKQHPIDWLVYSSAVVIENPNSAEIKFANNYQIKHTKRGQFINFIITNFNLKLIAIAGTHGKTTTTAMVVWLANQANLPISYLLPAKTTFAQLGHFDRLARYFVIEADEFDNNFLSFKPDYSLISGLAWDHHEFFKTQEAYNSAFLKFINQSNHSLIWQDDAQRLSLTNRGQKIIVLNPAKLNEPNIKLNGHFNRLDSLLAMSLMAKLTQLSLEELETAINNFPGLSRRMEKILPNLYTDYAHTPEKINAMMSIAQDIANQKKQNIIIVYEPLTNRRQHFIKEQYAKCFEGAKKIYWVPSYLAREDKNQVVLKPEELIKYLKNPEIAEPKQLNHELKNIIDNHLKLGDMVVIVSGGGGQSLDDWLRANFLN